MILHAVDALGILRIYGDIRRRLRKGKKIKKEKKREGGDCCINGSEARHGD